MRFEQDIAWDDCDLHQNITTFAFSRTGPHNACLRARCLTSRSISPRLSRHADSHYHRIRSRGQNSLCAPLLCPGLPELIPSNSIKNGIGDIIRLVRSSKPKQSFGTIVKDHRSAEYLTSSFISGPPLLLKSQPPALEQLYQDDNKEHSALYDISTSNDEASKLRSDETNTITSHMSSSSHDRAIIAEDDASRAKSERNLSDGQLMTDATVPLDDTVLDDCDSEKIITQSACADIMAEEKIHRVVDAEDDYFTMCGWDVTGSFDETFVDWVIVT